jgi:phospholipase C
MPKAILRNRTARLVVTAFFAVTLAAWMSGAATAASASPAFSTMCGNAGTAPAVKHVILVMMENASYSQIVGSSNAPYQTSLTTSCGTARDYFGATHSSAANYLAVSAGEFPSASPPGCGSVSKCTDNSPNLYSQLTAAGDTWDAFMEAMPSNCDPHSVTGVYKIGHNPVLFYPNDASACPTNDVAVPSLTATSGPFYTDLQNQTLPAFSWVTPDESNDGEGSGTKAQEIQAADSFLSSFVPLVTSSPSYQAGNTLLLIDYDEGAGSDYAIGEDCTNKSLDLPVTGGVSAHQDSCHVPLFVIYPYTKAGAANTNFFDHYSITRTVEKIFGLSLLAHAGDAQTLALVNEFGIP